VAFEEEVRAFVRARLAPYGTPRWLTVVAELLQTATGKTQRFQRRKAAADAISAAVGAGAVGGRHPRLDTFLMPSGGALTTA
jgi:acyl-coenzyme A synthetase/AMP-(fatty) acid ligase